jgi:hypothetical protein
MGGGRWDADTYKSLKSARASVARSTGVKGMSVDFAYSAKAIGDRSVPVAPELDPLRINKKPFGKLESRDSAEHPESNAVFVTFDVTGSNFSRAVEAQEKLPNLMELLGKYLPDPQVLVAANDDYNVEGMRAAQISDYESDIRIDEHIRKVILVNNGGGNMGESYDLLLYAAARKTILDCFEKRKRKGYLFMYADEPFFDAVKRSEVAVIFGDKLQADIPITDIIDEVKQLYNIFIIWPRGGYIQARNQYLQLFGEECVFELQNPSLICELIASIVGINEEKVDEAGAANDLVGVGTDKSTAVAVAKVAYRVRRKFRDEDGVSA